MSTVDPGDLGPWIPPTPPTPVSMVDVRLIASDGTPMIRRARAVDAPALRTQVDADNARRAERRDATA